MPDKASHQARAEENEAFFHELRARQVRLLHWEVTALFYASVHWVQAYLASCNNSIGAQPPDVRLGGHHPVSHPETKSKMNQESNLRPIFKDYEDLKNRAEDARYELISFSEQDVQDLLDHAFSNVTRVLRPLLR